MCYLHLCLQAHVHGSEKEARHMPADKHNSFLTRPVLWYL